MAKSARSNRKKKLGTVRREKTLANTEWLKVAENRRQLALLACAAAPVQPVVNEYKHGRGAPKPEEPRGRAGASDAAGGSTSMETSDELPLGRKAARRAKHSKYGQKPKVGGIRVGKKKVGTLVKPFWGKGKKGGAKIVKEGGK